MDNGSAGTFVVPENRALTAEERRFLEWLITHGEKQAMDYAPQLAHLRVVGHCDSALSR